MKKDHKTRRQILVAVTGTLLSAGCLNQGSGGSTTTEPADQRGTEALVFATPVDSLPTPVMGAPESDVTVSVYEDFACPHCRDFTLSTLPKLDAEFIEPGEIRYERHDFPIPVHEEWSWAAANAARSVQNTADVDAFWRYADLLYENQNQYSYDLLAELAEEIDADSDAVRTAATEDIYSEVLETDRRQGRERGVTGTPTVFVNGRSVDSTFEEIQQAIQDELDSSG